MSKNLCKQLVIKNEGVCTFSKSSEGAKKQTEGLLYLECCLNPLPFGFFYDSSYKTALIGIYPIK